MSVVSASMAIRLYRTKQANSLTQYQYSESTMGKTGFEKKNSCETIVNDTLNSIKSISKLLKFARLKGETTKFYNEKKIKTKYHSHLSTSSLTATLWRSDCYFFCFSLDFLKRHARYWDFFPSYTFVQDHL